MSRILHPTSDSGGGPRPAGAPQPDLWAVVAPVCAAIALGSLAALLGSVRQVNPALVLHFGPVAWLSTAAGVAGGWWLARGVWRLARSSREGREDRGLRRQVTLGLWLMGAVLVAGFVLAVVRMPDTKRWDTFIGALLAVAVLGTIGWLLVKLRSVFGDPDDVS